MARAIPVAQIDPNPTPKKITQIVNLAGEGGPKVSPEDYLSSKGEVPAVITIFANHTIKVDY